MKKNSNGIWIIALLAVAVLAVGYTQGWFLSVSPISDDQHVYTAEYGNVQCIALDAGQVKEVKVTASEGQDVHCPPTYAEPVSGWTAGYSKSRSVQSCDVSVRAPQQGGTLPDSWFVDWSICNAKTGACTATTINIRNPAQGSLIPIETLQGNINDNVGDKSNILSDQYIHVTKAYVCSLLGHINCVAVPLEFQMKFTVLGLVNTENGNVQPLAESGKNNVNQGCYLPTSGAALNQIEIASKPSNDLIHPGAEHAFNYVLEWHPALVEDRVRNYSSSGYTGKVVCNNQYAYPVVLTTLASGLNIWKQNNTGFAVPCCPQQSWCNADFTLKATGLPKAGDTCNQFTYVDTGFPIGGYSDGKWRELSCQNGVLVETASGTDYCTAGCPVNTVCDAYTLTCLAVGANPNTPGGAQTGNNPPANTTSCFPFIQDKVGTACLWNSNNLLIALVIVAAVILLLWYLTRPPSRPSVGSISRELGI